LAAIKDILPRGFKAAAERIALEERTRLGLPGYGALCGFKLAKAYNVVIHTPAALGLTDNELDRLYKDGAWSALTMYNERNERVIVHKEADTPARQQSNMMHEMAHILRGHELTPHISGLPFFLRQFNRVNEEEARYLGAMLQLPRPALIWAAKQGMTRQDIMEYYTCSEEMVKFRVNSSGIKRQLSYLPGLKQL
jgi:Zn-dependent peptidase ImmA (M78 family)